MPSYRSRILSKQQRRTTALPYGARPAIWMLLTLALCSALVMPRKGGAQDAATPEPGSELIVTLITFGQGDLVWEKFGHNALRIRDTVAQTDLAYNWGIFDTDAADFAVSLVRGQMRYWMDVYRTSDVLAAYVAEDRRIWEQELLLTPAEKAEIRRLANENARPENKYYDYDYYRDNCSTRIRDLIDRVTGGVVRSSLDTAPSGMTYRLHTLRLLADSFWPYLGVQLVLGHRADRPISKWDEMFLPVHMMQHLAELRVGNADGTSRPLTGQPVLLHLSQRPAEPVVVRRRTLQFLIIGVLIGAMLALPATAAGRVSARGGRPAQSGSRAAAVAYGTASALWCAVAGVAGTLAACMWLFTAHVFMYQNETLLLLNPVLLPLAWLAPRAPFSLKARGAAILFAAAVAVLSALALFLFLLPWTGQANLEILALVLPAHAGLVLALRSLLWRRGATN